VVDIEDFIRQNKPKGRKSKLLPFKDQIIRLNDLGYSQEQICEYLSQNGVEVTQTGLSKFLIRHSEET
jgi:arginine repressor